MAIYDIRATKTGTECGGYSCDITENYRAKIEAENEEQATEGLREMIVSGDLDADDYDTDNYQYDSSSTEANDFAIDSIDLLPDGTLIHTEDLWQAADYLNLDNTDNDNATSTTSAPPSGYEKFKENILNNKTK